MTCMYDVYTAFSGRYLQTYFEMFSVYTQITVSCHTFKLMFHVCQDSKIRSTLDDRRNLSYHSNAIELPATLANR